MYIYIVYIYHKKTTPIILLDIKTVAHHNESVKKKRSQSSGVPQNETAIIFIVLVTLGGPLPSGWGSRGGTHSGNFQYPIQTGTIASLIVGCEVRTQHTTTSSAALSCCPLRTYWTTLVYDAPYPVASRVSHREKQVAQAHKPPPPSPRGRLLNGTPSKKRTTSVGYKG